MVDVSNTKVQYWTQIVNNLEAETVFTVAEQLFTYPLLALSSDWVLCVERFSISLNGVPFYLSSREETIDVYDLNDNLQSSFLLSRDAYSLIDLIDVVNLIFDSDDTLFGTSTNLTFSGDGRVKFTFETYADYYIVWPTYINAALGIAGGVGSNVLDTWSTGTRFDIGDEIQAVYLSSNLGVFNDTIGQAKINILTDVSFAQDYQVSVDSTTSNGTTTEAVTYAPRGRLIYNPLQRRFVNFSAQTPLQYIKVEPYYLSIDGSIKELALPPGGVFNVKIGFYKINAQTTANS